MCCERIPTKKLRGLPTSMLEQVMHVHNRGLSTARDGTEIRRHARELERVGDIITLRRLGMASEPAWRDVDQHLFQRLHTKTLLAGKLTV